MTQRAQTGPLQVRLARLTRAGTEAARRRAVDAAAVLAADIAAELPDGRADAAPTPTGAAVTVEARGLVAREFGTATRLPKRVIGPVVARLAEPG